MVIAGAFAAFLCLILALNYLVGLREGWRCLGKCFDESGVGLVWMDLTTAKVKRVNKAFAELLRTTPEKLAAMSLGGLPIPESLTEPWKALCSGSCVRGVDFKFRVANQPEIFVCIDAVPIRKSFRWAEALLVVRDVTEANIVSNRLLQGQKLEALGTLAGGVAHDFNNLLQVIIGYADMLPDSADVAKIRSASSRATALVRQLMIFSRRQSIEPRKVDCDAMVKDMIILLRPLLGPLIEVVVLIDQNLPPIWVDRNQIEMAITNLAVNSMHAMEGKPGKLTISAKRVDLPDDEPDLDLDLESGRYVKFRMEDNGSGIPKEHLSRIFEPFFTTKEVGKGTGLGLSTVYGVVHRNKGEIRVTSTVGVGTAFDIFLPTQIDYEEEMAMDSDDDDESLRASGTERVLIVEDEPMIRGLLKEVLTKHGYHASACQNGPEALQLSPATIAEIDILITDLIMPHMSGLVLAGELCKVNPNLKRLFISGYTAEIMTFEKRSKDEAFLEKPFSAADLLKTLRAFYAGTN